MSEYPLISCICPTRDRPKFLAQSLHYFQAQDYPNTELLVIDDSDEPTLTAAYPNVRQIYISEKLTIGMKRNIACSLAQGEIIAHWDDDDYYGPHRLSQQAAPILAKTTRITGMVMSLLLKTADTSLYAISEAMHDTLFGYGVRCGTLMYRSFCWRSDNCAYPNSSRGEDVAFLSHQYGDGERVERIVDPASYICIRHAGNTTDDLDVSGWQHLPIEQYLSASEQAFYRQFQAVQV